jgi:uridine kinase
MNQTIENSDQYLKRVLLKRNLSRLAESVTKVDLSRTICSILTPYLPRILSIVGGAASGKSTLAASLVDALRDSGTHSIALLNTDDYSVGTRSFRKSQLESKNPYITHDFKLLSENVDKILRLRSGEQLVVPKYNPSTGAGVPSLLANTVDPDLEVYSTHLISGIIELVIVEGDFQPLIKTDYVIYLHLSDKVRLENRIRRDIKFRNYRTKSSVRKSFIQRQATQHYPYTLPVADTANAIIWSKPRKHNDQITYMYDLFLDKYEP